MNRHLFRHFQYLFASHQPHRTCKYHSRFSPHGEQLEDRRLLTAGALDLSFGSGGKVISDFLGPSDGSVFVKGALQPDGKIVVVGQGQNYNQTAGWFSLARYNVDGSLDTNFGNAGRVTAEFGSDSNTATGLVIQSDGKIVVTGWAFISTSNNNDFAAARFLPNGSLDPDFDGDGRVLVNLGPGSSIDKAWDAALQSDGKIVIVGSSYSSFTATNEDFAAIRLNTDGSLDSSFGSSGKVRTDLGATPDMAFAVALDSAGRIIVGGRSQRTGTGNDFALVRYLPSGVVDGTFGNLGKITTDFGTNAYEQINGLAVQTDDRIVAVGGTTTTTGGGDMAVARYLPTGLLDSSFDGDGLLVQNLNSSDMAYGVTVQPDGKIVVVGSQTSAGTGRDFAIVRYTGNGVIDPLFGGDGVAVVDFGSNQDEATDVVLAPGGKLVAVGMTRQSMTAQDFALARLDLGTGALDQTFDNDGKVIADFQVSASDVAEDIVAVQPDGKLLAAGTTWNAGSSDFVVARYLANGALDPTFGIGGSVVTDFGAAFRNDTAQAMAIQADGKVVVVGYTEHTNGNLDLVMARYNADGSLDASFGSGGKVQMNFEQYSAGGFTYRSYERANSVVLQADGKIIVTGWYRLPDGSNNADFFAARFNPSGTLDTSFALGYGFTRTVLAISSDRATSVALQPDGKIVTAVTGNYQFTLYRLNTNGTPDTGFGSQGIARTTSSGTAHGLVVQPDGRLVVVGYMAGQSGIEDFALARFNPNGSMDAGFGTSGIVKTNIGATNSRDLAYDAALQPDGKIVVAGTSSPQVSSTTPNTTYDFAVAWFNVDGSLDTTFDSDGKVTTDLGGGDVATSVLIQPDTRIVVSGYNFRSTTFNSNFALTRFLGINNDGDGVPDSVENAAPNGGDGNDDGTPDSQQDNVTSLPNSINGTYVTLQTPAGTDLGQVSAVVNPSPADAPEGVEFPIGFFDFSIETVSAGTATTVTIFLPAGVMANTYYKYGRIPGDAVPRWYEFLYDGTTGAETNAQNPLIPTNQIVLHFVDGQRGDDDLLANGIITDPGSPALEVNSAPMGSNSSISGAEDMQLNIVLTAADSDGDSLTFAIVTPPTHGTLSGTTLNLTYTPNPNYNGPDSFTFQASDGSLDSNLAAIWITVTPVNDAPVAEGGMLATAEDSPNTGTLSAADIDGPALTYSIVSQPEHGAVLITDANTGAYLYTPNPNYFGPDSFTFQASDGSLDSNVAAIWITVTPVNDAPVAEDDSLATAEDKSVVGNVLMNDSDPDLNDRLSVVAVNGVAWSAGQAIATMHGSVSMNANGDFTYTPAIGCEATSDTFKYTISDGHGGTATTTVTIIIAKAVGDGTTTIDAMGVVRIGGTAGPDTIVLTTGGGHLLHNGASTGILLTAISEIRVWGREGADIIDLSGLSIKSFIQGGGGGDTITGSSVDDIIFGGYGDDTITGGSGHDFLIGGAGKDRLVGSSGHDILVAGDIDCVFCIEILRDISRAWAESRTTSEAESIEETLNESLVDGDSDVLTGSSGADLFIIGCGDKITDFQFGKPNTNKDGDVVIMDSAQVL